MGVLEDAIREHLDLKRKHGAPEQELERQEVEALGPVRRDVPEQEPAAEAGAEEAEQAPPQAEQVLEPVATEDEHEPSADPGPEAEHEPSAELAAEPALEQPHAEHELPPDPPLELESEHDLPPDPEPGYPSAVDQPTELFEPPDVRSGDTPARGFPAQDEAELDEDLAEEDEDADVLEDTPDFLQDAPEHDRLWFEQKPPRDFDFD
jgi:hypothetical protein